MQRSIMDRRAFAFGLGSLIAGLPGNGSAKINRRRPSWVPWKKVPSIVVISTVSDAPFSDVDKAVSFWNGTLEDVGTPFRLGPIIHIPEVIPHDDIFRTIFDWQRFDLSKPGYNRRKMVLLNLPAHIRRLNGDVIVALTGADGPSFAMAQRSPGKVLVAIQNPARLRGRLIQNLIAHELGHVIGLGHNAIPTALMCGDIDYITQCSFEGGAFAKFQPLTLGDKAELLDMYPPSWTEEQPSSPRWKGDPPANPNVRTGARVHVAG